MNSAGNGGGPGTATRRLPVRDEVKPFALIAAIAAGIVANRLAARRLTHLSRISDIAMFAVMAFVEVKDVAVAFRKVKATSLALVTNFVITPAFAWALGWLILRHYPDLWAGVILYTLTPCIGWYLIFTDQADGDMAWGCRCCRGTWCCRSPRGRRTCSPSATA
jgi:ACR3 family arsenite transporter